MLSFHEHHFPTYDSMCCSNNLGGNCAGKLPLKGVVTGKSFYFFCKRRVALNSVYAFKKPSSILGLITCGEFLKAEQRSKR